MPAQPNLVAPTAEGPGVHVLVIGISAYRHLPDGPEVNEEGERSGLGQLNGPARSAASFAAWMHSEHYHPTLNTNGLKSLRVLLSPADGEDIDPDIQLLIDASEHASEADSETVDKTVNAFVRECKGDPDSMAVIYVCGHGVQIVGDGARLLLSDYGDPEHTKLLDGALDLKGFYNGLYGHEFPQKQLWFYDCCAQEPKEAEYFEQMTGGIAPDPAIGFADVSPIYMAASEGTYALGKTNENTFFCQAILWALSNYGAARLAAPEYAGEVVSDYVVTTSSLNETLKFILSQIAFMNGGSTQFFRSSGRANPALFHEYTDALRLPAVIDVKPANFPHQSREVRDPDFHPIDIPNDAWPLALELLAGLYVISVEPGGGAQKVTKVKSVTPSSAISVLDKPAINTFILEIEP